MSKRSQPNYQNVFIKLAVRHLPHHFLLFWAAKMRQRWLISLLDTYAARHIVGKTTLNRFPLTEQQAYLQITAATALWQGNGRYQHGSSKALDVLDGIVRKGSLRPVEDAYAVFAGEGIMVSISLTRFRVIARSYADMHGKGSQELHRYGSALMWTSYHYGLFYARLFTVHYFKVKKFYKTWHELTHDTNGHNTWGKKSNKNARDVWDVFGLGSDIKGNYPLIWGVRSLSDRAELPSFFDDYEVRLLRPISLTEVTHIEAPQARIDEVKKILHQHHIDIPVFPIELGEQIASQQTFSRLLGFTKP